MQSRACLTCNESTPKSKSVNEATGVKLRQFMGTRACDSLKQVRSCFLSDPLNAGFGQVYERSTGYLLRFDELLGREVT